MMNRRQFLTNAGSLALASTLPQTALADDFQIEKAPNKSLSILQGLTTATSTQLTVDLPRNIETAYVITDRETGRRFQPVSVKPVYFGDSSTRVDKLKFTGLELGHRYQFSVIEKKKNKVLDERYLTTVDLNRHGARVALMTCMNSRKSAKSEIWPSAEAANLDYLLWLGDNVYGDLWILQGPGFLWSRYVATREKLGYYHWKTLKPVIAVWDDHDFGTDDGTGTYKHKDAAFQIFQTFFAQEADGEVLQQGIANSTLFKAFGQNFAFFDNRYFRSLQNPDGSTSFLGHQQVDWMSSRISKSKNPTWVMEGSPFFGRLEKGSSYQGTAPQEMHYLFSKIRGWNSPAVLAGGDVHYSEISRIDQSVLGYSSFEVISSCMHSNTKSKFYDNPNPQVAGYLKENFLVLEQQGLRGDAAWKMSCIGKNLVKPFETRIQI